MKTYKYTLSLFVFLAASAVFAAAPGTTRDAGMEMDYSKPLNFKVHFVERTDNPPVIDGKCDDECWKSASVLDDFYYATFAIPYPLRTPRTEMRYLWDDNYLYISAKCYEDCPENMVSYRSSIAQKAILVHCRDCVEMSIDGKNDEWTRHQFWISGSNEKLGGWEYDFGWGLITDNTWGTSADWTQVVGEGEDELGPYWFAEERIALADLEIQPRVGYIFGCEPARFRFNKKGFKADGSVADDLSAGSARIGQLQVTSWGTQGTWHQSKTHFGKCILVDKKPADLVSGLRLAYPDLDKRIVRIRGSEGYLSIKDGKTARETYLDKCRSLIGETREAFKLLDPVIAVTNKSVLAAVKTAEKFKETQLAKLDSWEDEFKSVKSVDAARLDKMEKDAAAMVAEIDKCNDERILSMMNIEKTVRFPVNLDTGDKPPAFDDVPTYTPRMDEWKDPTLVKWAIPSTAKRRRVLAVVNEGDVFAVQHLRNRIDIEADIVPMRTGKWAMQKKGLPHMKRMENALARGGYDGLVFIGIGPNHLPNKLRRKVSELSIEGLPVVCINASWGEQLKEDKDFVLGAPAVFDCLSYANPEMRNGRPENVKEGPGYFEYFPTNFSLSAPKFGVFGKGRTTVWSTKMTECESWFTVPRYGPSLSTTPDRRFQDEYCLGYIGRIVLEGLGMRGPACAKRVELPESAERGNAFAGELDVYTKDGGTWTGDALVTVRDCWGSAVSEQRVRVNIDDGAAKVPFTVPGLDVGRYSVDAILLDGYGYKCDFAASYVEIVAPAGSPRITDAKCDAECFDKNETIRATVNVAGDDTGFFGRISGNGCKVLVEATDPRLRVLVREEFPVKDGKAKITISSDRLRLNCHFLWFKLVNADGITLDCAKCYFFRHIGDIEDFRGFDGATSHGGKDVEARLSVFLWHGTDILQQGNGTMLFYGVDPATRNRIPGSQNFWLGALNCPAWKKWLHDVYSKQARELKARNGRFLSLGDDSVAPDSFAKGRVDWINFVFKTIRRDVESRVDAKNPCWKAAQDWCDEHGIELKVSRDFSWYWSFQIKLEKGEGLKKLLNGKYRPEELKIFTDAFREAYDDIRVFNHQNGVNVKSFDDITFDTVRALNPDDRVEWAYFLKHLSEKYEGDIAKLNAAWGTDEKDFWTIEESVLDRQKLLGQWTAEMDKLEFLEDSFLMNCRIIGDAVHSVDPEIAVGYGASGIGNCIFDYFKYLDACIPYGGSETIEIIRSRKFRYSGETIGWYGTSFGSDEESVPRDIREQQGWHSVLTGCNITWMWACVYGLNGARTISPSGFGWTWGTHREIQRGPGKLILGAKRENDGIAIFSSRDTGRMTSVKIEPTSHQIARKAWGAALTNQGLQYTYVTPEDIADGALERDGIRLIVFPMCDIVDEKTVAAVKTFIKAGGYIIADFMPGTYGRDAKKLSKGTMDEVIPGERAFLLDYDLTTVVSTEGKRGAKEMKSKFADALAKCGIKPVIRVVDESGNAVSGVEITRFTRGDFYSFSLEKTVFPGEKMPIKAFVELPAEGYVYDVRNGTPIVKNEKRLEVTFRGADTMLFSCQPYEVKSMSVAFAEQPVRGGTLKLRAQIDSETPIKSSRVFRVEFVPPAGFPVTDIPPIKRYVEEAPGGILELDIPLAFNERGDLSVEVTDVASGVGAVKKLEF